MTRADGSSLSTTEVEALGWIDRVTSGDATEGDLAALAIWRNRSDAHQRAFADALRLRRMVAARADDLATPPRTTRANVSRRMLVGGALSTAMAGYFAVHPPLGLWPSLEALGADYRTAKGERRRVDVANARIELNTQTALAKLPDGVRLVAGELAADILPGQSFVIAATRGVARAQGARVNVSEIGDEVCVTCLGGAVRVEHANGTTRDLRAGTLVRYDDAGLGTVEMADLTRTAAWRSGLLIFRDEPLAEVVAQINRYRRGRIVLADAAAGQRTFNGVFRIDQIDDVVAQIRSAANIGATALPGGVLILG